MWAWSPARIAGDHIVHCGHVSHARLAGAGVEGVSGMSKSVHESRRGRKIRSTVVLISMPAIASLIGLLWLASKAEDFVRWCGITQTENNNTKHGDAPATGLRLEAGNE